MQVTRRSEADFTTANSKGIPKDASAKMTPDIKSPLHFILVPEDYNDSENGSLKRNNYKKQLNTAGLPVRVSLHNVFSRDLKHCMFCGYQYSRRHQLATSSTLLLIKQYFQCLLGYIKRVR